MMWPISLYSFWSFVLRPSYQSFVLKHKKTIAVMSVIIAGFAYFSLAFSQSVSINEHIHKTIDFPPIHGGSDQVDYHIMAYTVATENFLGKIHNAGMRAPFKEFKKNNTKPLTKNETHLLNAYLRDRNESKPKPYAYRPWLYSTILGLSYKVFGYTFTVGRTVNVVLYGLTALILMASLYIALGLRGVFIGLPLFLSVSGLAYRTGQFLTEPTVALCLSLTCLAVVVANTLKYHWLSGIFLGLAFGLCMWAKQLFAPVFFIVLFALIIYVVLSRSKRGAEYLISVFIGASVLGGPLAIYNVTTTGVPSMLMGSSGWLDMPSAYDQGLLEGKNRFQIREKLFKDYAEKTSIVPKGAVGRSLAGKAIFTENLHNGVYKGRLGKLMVFKLKDELIAKPWEWTVRFFALLGLLFLCANISIPLAATIFGTLGFISLTVSVGGRTFDTFWPLICFCAVAGIIGTYEFMREKIHKTDPSAYKLSHLLKVREKKPLKSNPLSGALYKPRIKNTES